MRQGSEAKGSIHKVKGVGCGGAAAGGERAGGRAGRRKRAESCIVSRGKREAE